MILRRIIDEIFEHSYGNPKFDNFISTFCVKDDKEIKDRSGLSEIEEAGLAKEPVTLSNDEYFVIGDNRKESIDSRSNEVGNVRRKDILGKASFIFWPFNRVGIIK